MFLDPEPALVNAGRVAREFASNFSLHPWESVEVVKRLKGVGIAYTKLLILLEFSPLLVFANRSEKRLKYGLL